MPTITLSVDGMHCGSCGMTIDETLEDLRGVQSSRTNVRKGVTVVEHDGKLKTKQIANAVRKLGYRVEELASSA